MRESYAMEKSQKFEVSLNTYDSYGNTMMFDPESTSIFVKPSGKPRRMIGQIKQNSDEFIYYKKEDESHVHRKTRSWTVPRVILKEVDRVIYETDKALYEISHNDAYKIGFQSTWDDVTVDKKMYLPIAAWKTTWKDPTMDKRIGIFGYDWYSELKEEFDKPYYSEINAFVSHKINSGVKIFPEVSLIHRAFRETLPKDVSVVMMGDGPLLDKHYNGLCYSVNGNLIPEKTKIVMKLVETDYHKGFNLSETPDFSHWAAQGVLMINNSLTADQSGIHQCGWDKLMTVVIESLAEKRRGIVFIFWGRSLDKYKALISPEHHLVIEDLIAPFTRTNHYLKSIGKKEISW